MAQQISSGNIDLYKQPKVKNPDGTISTVDSIGTNIDGKEYLLPTVTPDGRHFTGPNAAAQAFEEFKKTGRHLGIFNDVASSNAYGKQLHEEYASGKYDMSQQSSPQIDFSKLPDPIDLTGLPDDPDKHKTFLEEFSEASRKFLENHPLIKKLTNPLVDIRGSNPTMKAATDSFAQEHPVIGGAANFAADVASSLTSPLNLGMAALTGGESVAAKAGMTGLQRTLGIGSKIASAPFAAEGAYNLATSDTTAGKVTGGLELAGGLLGLKRKLPGGKPSIKPELEVKPPIVEGEIVPPSAPLATTEPRVSPQTKLLQALDEAKPLTKQQQDIYSAERSERLGRMKGVDKTGEEGFHAQLSTLKGEMPKVHFDELRTKLEQADVDELFDTITKHPAAIGYNELHAKTGLAKMLSGSLPQLNEQEALARVFGPEMVTTMRQKLALVDKSRSLVADAVNLPRELMASYDMSAPLRQGLGLIHKKEYWTSLDDMFKAFGSDKAFRAIQESIEAKPTFELSQKSGLQLTDLTNLSNREEAFASSLGERIPVIGRGVRASNRAYVGFLNKLRSDTFDSLIKSATDSGQLAANPGLANEIAQFVNTATGRGSLGSLERHAELLNSTFFSPRLIASRLTILNPKYYVDASPMVRKEALKSLLAITTAGGVVTELGRMAGGTVSNDPTSTDFRKLKIGNTRLDLNGGFQQYVVAASRLISGQQTSSSTGKTTDLTAGKYGQPTRLDVAGRFATSKLNPVLSFAVDMLRGTDYAGQPVNLPSAVASRFVPMMIQDIVALAKDDPSLAKMLLLPAAGALGAGIQTYGQPNKKMQFSTSFQ